MTLALVNHSVQQGRDKEQGIAMLTAYLEQLHRLAASYALLFDERDQKDLDKAGFEDDSKHASNTSVAQSFLLRVLIVATVENSQGDEAKIVVVSLVRNNPQQRFGFLRTRNRVNVLQCRAKHGMYLIGNSETSNHIIIWAKVIGSLREEGNSGENREIQSSC
ncbi:hypothetical protein PMG11_02659 [Penicillium brasilianum]|uniref:DNA2/NAM7 helicase-like C-terminal domain-containing protein n=1 Tax=Penicillium brasilianum TaxID=104259 RepID=A0A0F7TI88_PENBI|nr:hypothetical protein PMG11_02659 [Penicillium brasilianum]